MNRRKILGMAGLGTAATFSQVYPEGADAACAADDATRVQTFSCWLGDPIDIRVEVKLTYSRDLTPIFVDYVIDKACADLKNARWEFAEGAKNLPSLRVGVQGPEALAPLMRVTGPKPSSHTVDGVPIADLKLSSGAKRGSKS